MLTLNDVKEYLKIDYTEEDNYLTNLIEVSQIYIDSMVGEAYKIDTKATKLAGLLQMKLISDMYDNRGTEIEAKTKKDMIVTSILDKLSNYTEVIV
ncbi:head-tail connector protein [Inconstantimicrobium mannanitabidum]|uniref:Uncharacterized protein n=1 Tax=Inconstantimicrobium mannanitabidum TaxID=1604901 RepID=A0ACB5R9C6_9CLOT|nr:head-tail connector protein [Clostridium sp. TW13]GKX65642.1 hypothetical protein rsdtw13_09000 [Clostridium sp. TW13]